MIDEQQKLEVAYAAGICAGIFFALFIFIMYIFGGYTLMEAIAFTTLGGIIMAILGIYEYFKPNKGEGQ